jgi:hypothetical protein
MVIRKMTRTKVEILLKHVLPVYSLAEIGVGTDPMIPGFLNVKIDFWTLFNHRIDVDKIHKVYFLVHDAYFE